MFKCPKTSLTLYSFSGRDCKCWCLRLEGWTLTTLFKLLSVHHTLTSTHCVISHTSYEPLHNAWNWTLLLPVYMNHFTMHETGPCYCLYILGLSFSIFQWFEVNAALPVQFSVLSPHSHIFQKLTGSLKLSSGCSLRIVPDSIETPKVVSLKDVILLIIKLLCW